ncbi:unnamed protein product [Paramecium pentaurelia]|uniref:Transmembrane protein n=1 Tax=Paramecium pentaurelia TaxID=43138 RepID=A0A8S1XM88_9CILI|nr:unnamed protein product [Paramecium pentaurelia]
MKSSLVTENGHRTKTNPDHNSKFSYSSCKSCLTSERQTQVKATCKVLYEMREDQSSKLTVKFTQLQIVLATQSIIQLISKFKSAKLQTYLRILIQDSIFRQPSLHPIKSIPLPKDIDDCLQIQIKHKPEYKQRHHFQTQKGWILMQTLNKLKQKQQRFLFQLINKHIKLCKGTQKIIKFIKKYNKQQQCRSLIFIMQINQNYLFEYNWKDIEQTQLQLIQKQDSSIELISIKEQLAIKLASTTNFTSLLNEKYRKMNFYFFLKFLRYQNNQSQLISNLQQGIEINQSNYNQSYIQENQQIIAAQNLHSFLFIKLQNYLQTIKIFHLKNDYQMIDTMNNMIINSNSNLKYSFDIKRNLDNNQKSFDMGINNFGVQKQISSLQNISDIDESTKSIIQENQPLEQCLNKKKTKNQHNKIKNAIKSYCNLQLQNRVGKENTIKVENFDLIKRQGMRKQQLNHNQLYTPYLLIVVMTILLILFLK